MSKLFKKAMISLLNDGTKKTVDMMNEFNTFINDIDFDKRLDDLNKVKTNLVERGNQLINDFSDFLKQATDSVSDFKVTLPFDGERGERFKFKIEDGNKLVVFITYESDNETKYLQNTFTIPANCVINETLTLPDPEKKTMTIIIPKAVENNDADPNEEDEQSVDPNATDETKAQVTEPHDEEPTEHASEAHDDEPSNDGEIDSVLEKKIEENVKKVKRMFVRDKNGRFTIKKPKNDEM